MSESTTNNRVTRASNKSTHPGVPDIDDEVLGRPLPKPRRTKAQIAADNVAAAEKKVTKAEEARLNKEKRDKLLKQIATLEKEMNDEEKQAEREAAHPPAKKRMVLVAKYPAKGTNTHLFNLSAILMVRIL